LSQGFVFIENRTLTTRWNNIRKW